MSEDKHVWYEYFLGILINLIFLLHFCDYNHQDYIINENFGFVDSDKIIHNDKVVFKTYVLTTGEKYENLFS